MQIFRLEPLVDHLFRRVGFGATPDERAYWLTRPWGDIVEAMIGFDPEATGVDHLMHTPDHVGITVRAEGFTPQTVINDARQRWLFRMVHSPAPLQEKMALFWHQYFATAYGKIAGIVGSADATRMMDARPADDPGGVRGQIELFRQHGLGSFRELLVEVAKDPAMIVWLDGRSNVKSAPQENFGRELMELYTIGVGHFGEADVRAASRVFTGWNLAQVDRTLPTARYAFNYNAAQHDTGAKTFSFQIYPDGSSTIPARAAAGGMQDGLDLIHALAFHPETARRLARQLWTWFVSDMHEPDAQWVERIARTYVQYDTHMRPVIREVLRSDAFRDGRYVFARYAWPAEYVVRALKEVGCIGYSVNSALTPLVNMGQQLYEPPDVNGWSTGSAWCSTGAMLARMNFASQLAANQRVTLRNTARSHATSPESLVAFATGRLRLPALSSDRTSVLHDYVRAGGTWTGSDAQLLNKTGGLFHLLVGSGEFQFV